MIARSKGAKFGISTDIGGKLCLEPYDLLNGKGMHALPSFGCVGVMSLHANP